jgi:hypothetical protein
VKNGFTLQDLFSYFGSVKLLPAFPNLVSYFFYVLVLLFLTKLSILISSKLGKDSFKYGEIISIEHANNSFLPSYLGYFFVALSVGDLDTLIFVYSILFIFTFFSQALYFNPLFLVFGYHFYHLTTTNGAKIFLISKSEFKTPKSIEIEANRINNYTFIDRGKGK